MGHFLSGCACEVCRQTRGQDSHAYACELDAGRADTTDAERSILHSLLDAARCTAVRATENTKAAQTMQVRTGLCASGHVPGIACLALRFGYCVPGLALWYNS